MNLNLKPIANPFTTIRHFMDSVPAIVCFRLG